MLMTKIILHVITRYEKCRNFLKARATELTRFYIFIFSFRHWPELTDEVSSFRYIKYNTIYIVAYIM